MWQLCLNNFRFGAPLSDNFLKATVPIVALKVRPDNHPVEVPQPWIRSVEGGGQVALGERTAFTYCFEKTQ